jgi:hypothetical protein
VEGLLNLLLIVEEAGSDKEGVMNEPNGVIRGDGNEDDNVGSENISSSFVSGENNELE